VGLEKENMLLKNAYKPLTESIVSKYSFLNSPNFCAIKPKKKYKVMSHEATGVSSACPTVDVRMYV